MTAPRQPRHALRDTGENPPVLFDETPTHAIPVVPRPRAPHAPIAGRYDLAPVVPWSPLRSGATQSPEGPVGSVPAASSAGPVPPPDPWPTGRRAAGGHPVRARRGRAVPAVLAGVTVLVLGLGVASAIGQTGDPAGVVVSGR